MVNFFFLCASLLRNFEFSLCLPSPRPFPFLPCLASAVFPVIGGRPGPAQPSPALSQSTAFSLLLSPVVLFPTSVLPSFCFRLVFFLAGLLGCDSIRHPITYKPVIDVDCCRCPVLLIEAILVV